MHILIPLLCVVCSVIAAFDEVMTGMLCRDQVMQERPLGLVTVRADGLVSSEGIGDTADGVRANER